VLVIFKADLLPTLAGCFGENFDYNVIGNNKIVRLVFHEDQFFDKFEMGNFSEIYVNFRV
jgi:hypothetical protein